MKRLTAIFSLILLVFSSMSPALTAKTPDKSKPEAIRTAPPAPKFSDAERQTELAARRKAVADKMADNSILVLFSAEPKIYAGDVDFIFRQENNLYYLTNLKQRDATFVMTKAGGNVREFLFLPKRNPVLETWNGYMYSNDDAARISGLKTIFESAETEVFLRAMQNRQPFAASNGAKIETAAENLYLLLPADEDDNESKREFRREFETAKEFAEISINKETEEIVYQPKKDFTINNAQPIFAELRLFKSPYEIKLMQHAIDITTEAQMRAMATVKNVKYEYETQAEIEYVFRKRNADYWGYPSIVGCGPNATTLHYVESQGAVNAGDLFLIDVGAEYDHYTADITRTFPVNGKFTKAQSEIYQIVYDAQEAAAAKLKPGARFNDASQAAAKVAEEGLAKLGLIEKVGAFIPGTEKDVPDGKGGTRKVGIPQFSLFYLHGLGHWLGMNVHDVGKYVTILKKGMILTNEPGIYIRSDALDYLPDTPEAKAFIAKIRPAFEKYKDTGVRIEDDMLITDSGVEWMSKNLPRKLSEIESFMARSAMNVALVNTAQDRN